MRPSTQQQQFVTICKAICNISRFACPVFGLLVSATQYSIIDCKNDADRTLYNGIEEIDLHTKSIETFFCFSFSHEMSL